VHCDLKPENLMCNEEEKCVQNETAGGGTGQHQPPEVFAGAESTQVAISTV
jgi:hypothetical protein